MSPAATCSLKPSRWASLAPDLLGDVSGRPYDDAADFVRLHAVCTAWREALLSVTSTAASHPPFLPYLLTPCNGLILCTALNFGRPSPGTTCTSSYSPSCDDGVLLAVAPNASSSGGGVRNWVASADGRAAWNLSDTRLVNLMTGGVTPLPCFHEYECHQQMNDSLDIVYADGTVFLYTILHGFHRRPTFTAAILHPGDKTWTFVKPRVNSFVTAPLAAAYHNGKIIVLCAGVHYWCAVDYGGSGGCELEPVWDTIEDVRFMHSSSYALKFGDELLWVSVQVQIDSRSRDVNNIGDDLAHNISLTVHALEEVNGKMRWVARDGRILGDSVLLLGYPASFAVDARQLDMEGGCAYFVLRRSVFKYSFMDREAKLVKHLRPVRYTDMTCLWIRPQPVITPIQEIRRRLEAPKKKKQKVYEI